MLERMLQVGEVVARDPATLPLRAHPSGAESPGDAARANANSTVTPFLLERI